MQEFKTPKGTVLPLMNLKGKPYLQVAYRIIWFREEHPDWSIETELLASGDEAICKATIKDANGKILATGHKSENKKHFQDNIEKSETSSIGRALALIGYGTQFAVQDLDEGERIVDSPISRPSPASHVPFKNAVTSLSSGAGETKIKPKKLGELDLPHF